jgi:hypothetical protein
MTVRRHWAKMTPTTKALLVFRSDCLADSRGERTGIPGAYFEFTLGYVRHLTSWGILRPEVQFDYTGGQTRLRQRGQTRKNQLLDRPDRLLLRSLPS